MLPGAPKLDEIPPDANRADDSQSAVSAVTHSISVTAALRSLGG